MKTAMKNFALVVALVVGASGVARADVVPATTVAPPTPIAAGIATPPAQQQPVVARPAGAAGNSKQMDPARWTCLQHAAYSECATPEQQQKVLARLGLQQPLAARPLANGNVATTAPTTAAQAKLGAAPTTPAPLAAAPTPLPTAPTVNTTAELPTDTKNDTTTAAASTNSATAATPAQPSFLDKSDPALAAKKDVTSKDGAVKDSSQWSRIGTMSPNLPLGSIAIGGLAIIGGIFALLRRKKPLATKATLEILATRSLGGKARIVWLVAGNRELVISVAGNNVGLLSQWMRPSSNDVGNDESYSNVAMTQLRAHDIDDAIAADAGPAMPADNFSGIVDKAIEGPTMSSRYAANAAPAPTASTPASITQISALATTLANSSATQAANAANAASNSGQSAAVSGLLRLRDRSGGTSLAAQPANDAAVPTADSAHWAKNILAAIGQRGARS